MVGNDILTVEEISTILRLSANTIHSRRWQAKSHCPLFKRGKRLYVFATEFQRWLRGKARSVDSEGVL